jgi:DNA-binding XRE family transcriptional regulator
LLAGVTRQTISSIETVQYNPSALLALLLARRLDKRVEELFFLEEKAMSTDQNVKIDERTEAVASQAIARAYAFITVALLIDFMYRRFVFHEAAWDLFVMLVVSGAGTHVYMVRHKVWDVGESFGWKVAIIYAVTLAVLAVVGFILAMTKTM